MSKEEKIKQLQEQIKKKVCQYVNAQKRYNGDSALSKKIEAEVDSLEIQIKMLKGTI